MAGNSLFADVTILQDQLRGIWRFKWVALTIAWCAALVFWTVVFLIPNKYEARAKVFVDSGTTLSQATKGISLSDNVKDEIARMTAALLGTPQLRTVANETGLMAGVISPEQQQAVIDGLRENITISAPKKHPGETPKLFTITYLDPNRARSVQVVNDLLNEFVEGSLSDKTAGSRQTEQFLRQQIAAYGRRLSATEQQLANFKKRNIGLLPSEQGDYFGRLQAAGSALTQLKESLYVAERKSAELAAEMKSGQQFTASAPAAALSGAGAAALDTEGQIEQTRQQLDHLLLKYTNRYPSVIALRQTLAQLEARRQRELAQAKKGNVGAASALGLTANPVYQRLEEDYNNEQVDVASIQQEIIDRRQEIAQLRQKMSSAPQVQAEYAQLTRNFDVTRKQYDALLARLDSTRLGQQAANTGLIKFQVIDPPAASFRPVSPKRALLIVGALLAALGAGFGVAYLLHLLRPVFVSTRQLGAATGLTVLGAVSLAWSDQHRAERRRSTLRYAFSVAALVVLGAAVLVLHGDISHVIGGLRT